MEDLATLGIAVDATQVDKATDSLDKFTSSGAGAETEIDKLINKSKQLGGAAAQLGVSVDEVENRVSKLKGSIDPLYAAQERLDKELAEANALYRAGAINAADYGKATEVLTGRLNKVEMLQRKAAAGAKLHSHEMLNLSRQSADVAVSLAMGMNPLMVLIQQGPQIAETFGTASARGLGFKAVLMEVAGAGWAAVAPFAPLLAGIAGVAAVIGGGFLIATSQANKSVGDLTDGLGLSEKQLKRLKDSGESVTITFGDTFGATMQVAGERLYNAFKGPIDAVGKFFSDLWNSIVSGLDWTVGAIIGGFAGAVKAVQATWRMIPAVIGDAAVSAANAAIGAIEWLVNKAREKVNILIRGANGLADKIGLGGILREFEPASLERLSNNFAGAMRNMGEVGGAAFTEGFRGGRQSWEDFKRDVTGEAARRRIEQIMEAAGEDSGSQRKAKSEAQKEYEKLLKQAEDFLKALKDENATFGMNAIERKSYEIDQAVALAPTEALTAAIREQGNALLERMRAGEVNDILKGLTEENASLELQASLINATNRERSIALAVLEAEQDLTRRKIGLETDGARRIIEMTRKNAAAQYDLDKGLGSVLTNLQGIAATSRSFADEVRDGAAGLAEAFGPVGKALGGIASIYADLIAKQDEYKVKLEEARIAGDADESERLIRRRRNAEISAYGDMIGAAKGFFKEKSAGYKLIESAEKAYRLFEFAMSAKSIAVKAAEVAAKLPAYAAEAAAAATAGAAAMFAALGPFGFVAVAAMGAVLAAWGFRGGGGGGASLPTAQARQEAQGRGSVFGDPTAQSASLANSLAIAEQYQNKDLEYSNGMLKALRSIDGNMGALAAAIVRSMSAGGSLDTSGLNLGTSGRAATLSNLGFGKTTTRTLNDQGIDLGSQSLASILAGSIQGNTFQEIIENVTKKAFGITYSNKTKTTTQTNPLTGDVAAEINAVIRSLRDGVLVAAKELGLDGAEAVLASFQVNIGKISFKDMTGAQIQEALNAVFGKLGDDMAKAIGGGLIEKFQKVGEGALETLTRLAAGIKVFDQQVGSLNNSLTLTGVAGIEAKQGIIDMLGGLESFIDLTDEYADKFLTEAERLAPVQAAVAAELARLGLAGTNTKEQFKAVVEGLDLTTESGRQLFAALMAVAPAFAMVADAAQEAVDQARANLRDAYDRELGGLQTQLNDANNRLSRARSGLMSAYQRQVAQLQANVTKAEERVASARDAVSAAYDREASALGGLIDRLKSLGDTLRAFRDDLTVGTESGLSPEDAYRQAKSKFEGVAARVAAGDTEAVQELVEVGKSFRDLSRDYFGSGAGFQADKDAITAVIDRAIGQNAAQLSAAEQQLNALSAMVSGLSLLNDTASSISGSLADLAAAQLAEDEARRQYQEQMSALNKMLDLLDGVEDGIFTLGDQQYNLVDGVFQLDDGLLDVASAIEELRLATEAVAKAEQQIAALKALVDPLLNINDSVLTVADAIAQLTAALVGQNEVGGYRPEINNGPGDGWTVPKTTTPVVTTPTPYVPDAPTGGGFTGGFDDPNNRYGWSGGDTVVVRDDRLVERLDAIQKELAKANLQRGAASAEQTAAIAALTEEMENVKRELGRK